MSKAIVGFLLGVVVTISLQVPIMILATGLAGYGVFKGLATFTESVTKCVKDE